MDLVVRPRKQVAQIMGKDFFRRDSGSYPNFLNHPPDVASVHSLTCSGNENQSGDNAFSGAVGAQRSRQLVGNQNDPLLALVANQDFPFIDALQSNRFEFIGLLFAELCKMANSDVSHALSGKAWNLPERAFHFL